MIDVLGALLIGFICGYGVRELVARRRRAEYRKRHPERFASYTE
jgi:membrane-associated phospholipid phosphatase